MFIKLAPHRKFQYTPHYYQPENIEDRTQRIRSQFRRMRHRARTRSLIWLIAIFAFLSYMMYLLTQIGK